MPAFTTQLLQLLLHLTSESCPYNLLLGKKNPPGVQTHKHTHILHCVQKKLVNTLTTR